MTKRCLLIIICLIGLIVPRLSAQATITLSSDSIAALGPLIINDTTDFRVRVRVDNSGSPDTIIGDLFYYYLTDSMINAGDTARVINYGVFPEMVYDGMMDTVSVDIQPDEIRTSPPMNLIVIWPAMIDPTILDIDSIEIYVMFEGYYGLHPLPDHPRGNIIFPSPAMTFLYIKPEEIDHISDMIITNMLGQEMKNIPGANLSSGWVNVDMLNTGSYIAILRYKDGSIATMKFLKE